MIDLSTSTNDIKENLESGSVSKVLASGIYDAIVKYVYLTEAKSGTGVANVVLTINGVDRNFTHYITWKETGKPEKMVNGKPTTMPGFKQLNSLAYCAVGKCVGNGQNGTVGSEEKTIRIYSREAQSEVPTQVPVLTELCGKPIKVGIKCINKHKTALVGSVYKPTTETFKTNEVDRYYDSTGALAMEIAQDKPAEYGTKWAEAHTGEVFEEKLKEAPIDASTLNAPIGSSGVTTKNLFGDD